MNKKRVVRLACFAIASLFVCCTGAFLQLLYRELDPQTKLEGRLFVPTKGIEDASALESIGGIKGIETTFESNGKKLNGWFYRNPKSKTVVIMSHGNAFNIAFYGNILAIEGLLSCGQSVFAYDYAGYGRSEGEANTTSAIDSAVAAYDCVNKTLNYAPKQISAVGTSIGSGITAQLMLRRKLAKVVLVSSFTCPRAIALDISPLFGVYPARSFDHAGLFTIDALKQAHPPLLLVHGASDSLIRLHEAKENFAAACEPKSLVILEHSDHQCPTPEDTPEFIDVLKKFFDQA